MEKRRRVLNLFSLMHTWELTVTCSVSFIAVFSLMLKYGMLHNQRNQENRMKGKYKVIEVKQSVFALNAEKADATRALLKEKGVFLLNLMASPGAGKTTLLKETISRLSSSYRIAVMEADIDGSCDADAISDLGVRTIQLHTSGLCHMDADMTRCGLEELGLEDVDIIILENIGNLVCPAEFDTGAVRNAMLLSVPEGEDKPLKYPLMFQVSQCVMISKTDTIPFFSYDLAKAEANIRTRNSSATIIPLSARTGEGVDEWCRWLSEETEKWKKG